MGIAYLSAVAKQAGHETNAMVMEQCNPYEEIRSYKPHVIAYSAVTGEHQAYFEFNKQVKEHFPDIFTIMGGAHPTYYPKCVEYQPIDAICMGEGEGAFVEMLERIASGQRLDDVKNLAIPGGPINPKRNLIGDLDQLPFPDRDLLFSRTSMGQFPLKTFMTSRGCPFPCTYCFEPVLKQQYKEEKAFGPRMKLDATRSSGKYERRHSPERVIEEILDLKKRYPVEFIKFEDDLFVLQVDRWLYEFVELYPKKVGIPFNALVRVDSISEEMARLLKQAGCVSLNIAVDSANKEVRERVVKKKYSNQEVIEGFHLLERHGIHVFNNMILGLPDTTIEDDKDAVRLNIASHVKFSSFSILMPYPGTEIGKYCEERGYNQMDVDSFGESLLERSPLSCFTEEEKDIQKNILYLGGLAAWQPWLANFILSRAVHWRNRFAIRSFMLIYYIVKVITLEKYIYPIKVKPFQGLKDFMKGFQIEVLRTMPELVKTATYPMPKPVETFKGELEIGGWSSSKGRVKRLEERCSG
jgi:radical SAM superfamily enzyme YgiQ (UPF0313 family)